MTTQNVQKVYVHSKHSIRDNGDTVDVPHLNTRGETHKRVEIADIISRKADLDAIASEVGNDIGEAVFVDGELEDVDLYQWVLDQYGI